MNLLSTLPISPLVLALGWLLVVVCARTLRSRLFAAFAGVVFGVLTLSWLGLSRALPASIYPAFAALQVVTWLYYCALSRPRQRPVWFRFGVSVPALWFAASTILALPWAVIGVSARWWQTVPGPIGGWWVPFALGLVGVVQSFTSRKESVCIEVGKRSSLSEGELGRARPQACQRSRGLGTAVALGGPLRIGVLSDAHVGPFVSAQRLRRACRRMVDANPDLVVFAGDLLTMESQREAAWLEFGLEPLSEMRGRVFACLGNHDLEDLETVRSVFERVGVKLLVDGAVTLEAPGRSFARVQVVGLSHQWGGSGSEGILRHRRTLQTLPLLDETGEILRVVMLHDPTGFAILPDGLAPLVISGHTHGGQLGLLSLGLQWTVLRWMARTIPDHGLWRRGSNSLYVQRGLGHYGFPIRLGVPAEECVVEVRRK